MSIEFVLIDFENVQPTNIGLLKQGMCKIKVFLGQSQSKLPLDFTQLLQPLGSDVEYIKISGNGPNAVDFHIAFYIGRLAHAYADSRFTIVSKDTGFDPLVKHLGTLKIPCKRVAVIGKEAKGGASSAAVKLPISKKAAAPKAKSSKNVTVTVLPEANGTSVKQKLGHAQLSSRVSEVVVRLKGLKAARPATLRTLQSSVRSWFKPPLDSTELASVIQDLLDRKKIMIDGTKVKYSMGQA